MENEENEPEEKPINIPRYALVPGRGRCRVLYYEGNGYFTVLDNRDRRVFIHRDKLTFTK